MKRQHSIGAAVAACAILAAVVWLLYRQILDLWWTYDDAYLIHIAVARNWREYFVNGEVWRSMAQQLFTPLLTASYDSELSMFGLQARMWYAVQLVELAVAAMVIFAAFRLWFDWISSTAAALLFVAGVPICTLATELMLMHYLESIILAALALLTFVLGLRWKRPTLLLLSALLYLAAMLAKEIAIPLPLLLCALPESELRTRVRALLPHGALLGIYLGWRWMMLGTLFGGYGWAITSVWALIASLPMKIILAFNVLPALIMLIGVVAAFRSRYGVALVVIGAMTAIGPIVPMAAHMEKRFAIAGWLWWSAAFVAGCASLRPRMAYALISAAIVVVIVANRQEWQTQFDASRRMSDEARLFFALGGNALLRKPLVPPAAMNEFKWLKESYQQKAPGSAWFYDDLFLCAGKAKGSRVWQYDHATGWIAEITDRIPMMTRSYCRAVRDDVPLSADFDYRGGTLWWRFGPYDDGSWRVVLGDGVQAFDVPSADAFRLGRLPGISLRVRYQSPQGWSTYSPEISLDFARRPHYTWHR